MNNDNPSDQPAREGSANPDVTTLNLTGSEPDLFAAGEMMQLKAKAHSGANWFFWIAGLSIINSIILFMDGQWSFLAGLGITQVIDGLAYQISGEVGTGATIVALVLDAMVAGFFVMFGLQARSGQNWAFIAGMIIYALDMLLSVLARDLFSIGFHLLALFFMYQGWRANIKLKALEQATGTDGANI